MSSSETSLQDQLATASQSSLRDSSVDPETEAEPLSLQNLSKDLGKCGLTDSAAGLIMESWRPSTQKAYNVYINQWCIYVKKHDISKPSYVDVAHFLASLYDAGAQYNTINVARSAVAAYLSSENNESVGKHPVVCKLVKGVFENRPALPKYVDTWDVDTVIAHLNKWPDTIHLSFKDLTLRTIALLALLSAQRRQTLHKLLVDDVKLYKDKCVIAYSSVLKQSKPGKHVGHLSLPVFENKKLCVVDHLSHYISRPREIRTDSGLFLSMTRPHDHVSIPRRR